jgi:hypothetical protein
MALVRSDPFRDVDRLFQQLWGGQNGNGSRSLTMPMDAYRKNDSFLIRLDLPGVSADAVEVEENVLTIKAERGTPPTSDGIEVVIAERPFGTFTRQCVFGYQSRYPACPGRIRGWCSDARHPGRGTRQAASDRGYGKGRSAATRYLNTNYISPGCRPECGLSPIALRSGQGSSVLGGRNAVADKGGEKCVRLFRFL